MQQKIKYIQDFFGIKTNLETTKLFSFLILETI